MGNKTADSIRSVFQESWNAFAHRLFYDSNNQQSHFEGVNYPGAKALHWALMDTARKHPTSYAWIDSTERQYLEKIGVSQILLDDLDRRKPVVDVWLRKMREREYIAYPLTRHLMQPYTQILKILSQEDADRLISGAMDVFQRDWPHYAEFPFRDPFPPVVEIASMLCQFFSIFGDNQRYDIFRDRFYKIGGPQICQ